MSFLNEWNTVRHSLRNGWSDLKNEELPRLKPHDLERINSLIEELRILYGKFEAEQILLEKEME